MGGHAVPRTPSVALSAGVASRRGLGRAVLHRPPEPLSLSLSCPCLDLAAAHPGARGDAGLPRTSRQVRAHRSILGARPLAVPITAWQAQWLLFTERVFFLQR